MQSKKMLGELWPRAILATNSPKNLCKNCIFYITERQRTIHANVTVEGSEKVDRRYGFQQRRSFFAKCIHKRWLRILVYY